MNVSESWSAQREALAVETLRASGHLRLRVRGQSMMPAIWPGDMVEVESCALSDTEPDGIVLSFREGRFFLHRFLDRDGDAGYMTRGDSMPFPDPAFRSDALLGRVVAVSRNGIPVDPRLRPWSGMIGFLLCHSSWLRRAALKLRGSSLQASADPETA